MKVLFSASEIYPFVKTGGLGDVAGALPEALAAAGVDIRLCLPGYKAILDNLNSPVVMRKLSPFFGRDDARLLLGQLPNGLFAYVLDCPSFYNRRGIYGDDENRDWKDNHLRFAALNRVAADIYLYDADWCPDIVHGNDWQNGLMPVYLAARGQDRPLSVMTIHNIAYQGLFPAPQMADVNLMPELFSGYGVEYYGKLGFLKAGLHYADALTTVSPTYAREIQSAPLSCGLEGLLSSRAADLTGILNGIDQDVWNPAKDKNLTSKYDVKSLAKKAKNREALLREFHLTVDEGMPVFGVISRLVPQKGLDLLVTIAEKFLKEGAAFVILGSGDKSLERQFQSLATTADGRISVNLNYDENLAHRIIGGADAVIVPSRFEPCGLVQMYALRYGTLPIVRRTGGLADSVTDDSIDATGFLFNEENPIALADAMERACELFKNQPAWKKRQENAMRQDFGWGSSAKRYVELYKNLLLSRDHL